jgi:hypothetical protein
LEKLLKQSEGFYILLKQYNQTKQDLPPSISTMFFPKKMGNQNSSFDASSDNKELNDQLKALTQRPRTSRPVKRKK